MIQVKRKEDAKPWVADVFPARRDTQIYVAPVEGAASSGQYINLETLLNLFEVKIVTFGELQELMGSFAPEQLTANLTTEVGWEDECFPCELRIAGSEHGSLDEGHPIFYIEE